MVTLVPNNGGRAIYSKRELSLNATLGVLLTVYVFNFLDRQIITILAEPIARELHLSDTQIGLLAGLSFALLYSALGLPIARYADRPTTDRVRVIAIAVAVWSLMTAACGLSRSFTQLLLARVGVGIGEAGGTPPAHSLITDLAPPEKRARAFAVYQLGPPLGGLIGMVLGGLLADKLGWRAAFFVVGIPGLVLALVVAALLGDPRRRLAAAPADADPAQLDPGQLDRGLSAPAAVRAILQSRAMRLLLGAAATVSFAAYSIIVWATIFFQRSYGLTAGQTGVWFGLCSGLASVGGVLLGGQIGDLHRKQGKQHLLTVAAVATMASTPMILIAVLAPGWKLSMALFFPAIMLIWFYVAPFYSAAQGLVPPSTRSVASAMILFTQSLIGLGLGPLVMGMASDLLKPSFGVDSLRIVLAFASLFAFAGGAMLWRARRYLPAELDRYEPIS